MEPAQPAPQIVLVGGGHTHVQVLRRHLMNPLAADLTIVVDSPVAIYSGMVPGLVAQQYQAHELEIDVRPLARRAGVRVLHARAERIDVENQRIHVEGRPPIDYDIASINIGSTVAGLDLPGVREHALPTRPIRVLVDGIDERAAALGPGSKVAVVGGGAGGVELAFCIDHRLRGEAEVSLLFSAERVLPGIHPRIKDRVERKARERGIRMLPNRRATAVTDTGVQCGDEHIDADLVVWVIGAAAHGFGRASGLDTDDRGFILVDDTLQAAPGVFAVGDCAVMRSWPEIPKAGVYAVRQGPVLIDNLEALLADKRLQAYRAQRDFFGIYNYGDGTAIGTKFGLPIEGRPAMLWKDRIDRVFMEKFQVLGPDGPAEAFEASLPPMPEMVMVCGGCAAKVGRTELEAVLERLEPGAPDPDVVLGAEHADDAVAWKHGDDVWVQNVDAFPAFVDDPWLVGRIGAHNANSDLYAKGVQPRFAMATVQIPESQNPERTLFQVMSGLRSVLDAEGITLLGGHTLTGEKLVVGLTVTGLADGPLWTIDRAQPGDGVFLTRALGTGVLFHADMAGRAHGLDVQAALERMNEGNRAASLALRDHDIHAVTDVTGFGLAGHLAEVVRASGVSAKVELDSLPALPGVLALLSRGERSTFHEANRKTLRACRADRAGARLELCFDPQTAGGLLFTAAEPPPGLACTRIGTIEPARDDEALLWLS